MEVITVTVLTVTVLTVSPAQPLMFSTLPLQVSPEVPQHEAAEKIPNQVRSIVKVVIATITTLKTTQNDIA